MKSISGPHRIYRPHLILEIADDLWQDCQMSEYDSEHRDPVWIQKYIEMSYYSHA